MVLSSVSHSSKVIEPTELVVETSTRQQVVRVTGDNLEW